jgi:hypothetical protein
MNGFRFLSTLYDRKKPPNNPNPQHSETHKRQARDSRRKRIVLGYFDRPGRWIRKMDGSIPTYTNRRM